MNTLKERKILFLEQGLTQSQQLANELLEAGFSIVSNPDIYTVNPEFIRDANIYIAIINLQMVVSANSFSKIFEVLESSKIPYIFITDNTNLPHITNLANYNSYGILDINTPTPILILHIQNAISLHNNILKSKEKEKSLTESVELMQNILDCSADYIFVKDRELRTILCNEMVAKAVGKKAEDLIGHNDIENGVDIELVKGNPEKGIRGYENDDLAALNGKTIINPMDLVYSENEVFIFDTVKRPLRNRNGEIIGLLGISRDITERKNAERLLASERERLAVTLQSIGDGVISTDTKGEILMFNTAAEELTGWKAKEAIGQPLKKVFHILHDSKEILIENPVEKIQRTGKRIELSNHTSLKTKSGKEKIISYTADPMLEGENKIIGIVIVFRDMTEKIKLESTIQRNQKLESIGILAGGIAHDFNNLLAGIFGYLEIASMYSRDNETVSGFINKAMTAFNRAKALTHQLLTFSKGGSPIKKILTFEPILKSSLQFSLSGSNISVQYKIAENLWSTEIDENQISQVIENLALNAQQAMPDGGTIIVKAENVVLTEEEFPISVNQSFIKISFTDNGIGIPKEILPRIFDPFFSLKKQGSGLGLTTAFSIIQKHNGFLDVESVEGKGSTFIIYLPAVKTKPLPQISKPQFLHKSSKAKILLMDDEKYICEIESIRMHKMGYEVSLARNGDEAIEIFQESEKKGPNFNLIILDLTIPGGKGGIQTATEIRKLNNKIPIIIASGYSESPAIADPESFGFNASLKKPYSKEDLVNVLNKLSI